MIKAGEKGGFVRTDTEFSRNPQAFQAYDEGSIPFTRSNNLNDLPDSNPGPGNWADAGLTMKGSRAGRTLKMFFAHSIEGQNTDKWQPLEHHDDGSRAAECYRRAEGIFGIKNFTEFQRLL